MQLVPCGQSRLLPHYGYIHAHRKYIGADLLKLKKEEVEELPVAHCFSSQWKIKAATWVVAMDNSFTIYNILHISTVTCAPGVRLCASPGVLCTHYVMPQRPCPNIVHISPSPLPAVTWPEVSRWYLACSPWLIYVSNIPPHTSAAAPALSA